MKKILITGSTSVIGSALGQALSSDNEVMYAGRTPSAHVWLDLNELPTKADCEVDVIIHCAASFKGNSSLEDCIENERVNGLGAWSVARLAQLAKCHHLIFINSLFAYHPTTSYGLSKKHADENLAFFCASENMHYTSLLPSQIYDTEGKSKKHQPFLYHLINQASKGEDIVLFGTEDPFRNFLFLDDLIEIIKRVLNDEVTGRFFCHHPESHSMSAIAKMIVNTFQSPSLIKRDESRPSALSYAIPTDDELYKRIQYRPLTNLVEGLSKIKEKGSFNNV